MNQEQYQWLKDNGYDPAVYDVDDQGNIFENPVNAAQPQKEVMSVPRAFGTSFAGNLLPAGGAMAASAPFLPLAVANPLVGVPVMMGAGLLGGYGTGKLQQAGLERFAPEALQEMSRAETDQPIASWLGGSAPSLLAFKPSLKGIEGLSAPLMRGRDVFTKFDPRTTARFVPAAVNVGVNAASAGAGQLVNMSEGGEFSAPRFLADTALGSILANPTKLGRKLGFPSLTPQRGPVTRLELTSEPILGSPMEEAQKLYGSMPEGNVGRPPSVSQVSKADKSAYEAYSGYKEPEPSKSAETLARELYSAELAGPSGKPPSLSTVANADKAAYEAYSGQRPPPAPEVVKNATEAAREVYTRLQGSAEEGPARITQEDLDAASEIAAVRGLRIQFEDLGGGRGKFQLETPDGVPIISIDPNAATRDTAIHEIGHDVFARSVGEGMQKGLLGSVEESPTYRAEYEARLNARDEQGNLTHTEKQARDIALEEGLIQRFGEEYPNVKPGEIRKWFNALKASIKDLVGMKLSPEDANAYLRYLTNENVPWKGVAVGKPGEERMQRAQQETPEFKSFFGASKVVDEQGKPKFVYHGTGADITQFKKDLLDKGALYGPGIYTTESTDVAGGMKGYSFKGLKPDDAIGEFSVNENLPIAEQIKAVKEQALKEGFTPEQIDDSIFVPGDDGVFYMHYEQSWWGKESGTQPNAMPLYAKIENPFDIDAIPENWSELAEKMDDVANRLFRDKYEGIDFDRLARAEGTENIDGRSLYKALSRSFESGLPGKAYANQVLQAMGYDGITHTGGLSSTYGSGKPHKVWIAFEPEQIKSATGNKGTFDPSNPDIRYQRPIGSEIKTPAELDYLASKGGPFADVATNVKAAYNTRDFKQGQWSSKYSLTTALPEETRVRLLNHLAGEFDSGIRSTPAADIRAAYDQLRNEYLPAIVSDYNAQGFTVRDTAGQRARGSNPTYFPLHAVADEVTNILTTKQGSPEWDKLKADFINWNTQLRQADGASLAEAQRYADEKFQERVGITSKPPGIESGIPFSGARKPEGYPLPPSWRSNDIIDILNNYTRRSATDFAYQQHVESSPVAMAALGAKTMLNNQPIPANVLQSTPLIINEPSVQSVLREYRGTPAQRTEGALQSFGRFVTAATIGNVSKVGDIGTSSFKGLVYLPASEYINGLTQFTNKIADFAALKERSYASGLNKRDAAENMRQVLGIAEDSTAFMDKAARVLSKVTFVNDLESVSRVIAQGWGETIVGINKKLALGGDKNATQMLDTLSPDWRTRSDADLAAQVGRLLQGSYDMRQLPASVLEGAAAPYLTWSKWSIGQYDSFMKYALQPAMQGNMKPLIGQMLIGVLGGGAISAVQEWLNNREGKDISWKELESWMQQNQGELGADGGQLLGQKLLSMAQKMGTFGFAGDLVKMTVDAAAGGASQGVATMPAIDAIYDVSKRAAAAGKALDDGEDFGLVLKALLQDSLTGHVQALRVARNWLDEDENLRYDDRRKRRLFDELMGLPSKGGTFAVNYSNLSERDFERGEITPQTGEEAFELVSRAREEATSPEDYASRIRKYKTSQNQIMPSLERQPMKAARYLSFVEGAEEGAGAETMRRYMTREYENKYRKSLIEGMSGLR